MGDSRPMTCEFCGEPLEPIMLDTFCGEQIVGWKTCQCEEAREALKKADEVEAEHRREERARAQLDACKKAGIGKRYLDADCPLGHEVYAKVERGQGVYLQGEVGCGKTYTACTAARLAIEGGMRTLVIDTPGLLRTVRASYSDDCETEADAIAHIVRKDLLVIDDLGKENPTDWTLQTLFSVIDGRYRDELPVIVTSQFKKSDLAARLAKRGDPETAQAIVSRLTEMCETVQMDGGDRRLG